MSAPLIRWLHPLSYLFDDILGWVAWFLLLPITCMALVLMSFQLEDMQAIVYLAAFVGILICWIQAVVKDYRMALARLWLLPCYSGRLRLRQAYVKAQWRLLSLLVVIMLALGLCQAVITPTLQWAEQLLHITLMMVNACMAVQLIGLKYRQDWRGLVWSAAVMLYLVGAAELGAFSIAMGMSVDLVILGLILLLRYQQLPQFWRNGLAFE